MRHQNSEKRVWTKNGTQKSRSQTAATSVSRISKRNRTPNKDGRTPTLACRAWLWANRNWGILMSAKNAKNKSFRTEDRSRDTQRAQPI